MINDIIEIAIQLFTLFSNQNYVMRFINLVGTVIDTAITFIPRLFLVFGYIDYFIPLELLLPFVVVFALLLLIRPIMYIVNVIVSLF